uniref:Uncharacterized protein n=1 Tax=Cucumis sativus TaxID=3659 RepID=A0A0A0KQB3_CUCSA
MHTSLSPLLLSLARLLQRLSSPLSPSSSPKSLPLSQLCPSSLASQIQLRPSLFRLSPSTSQIQPEMCLFVTSRGRSHISIPPPSPISDSSLSLRPVRSSPLQADLLSPISSAGTLAFKFFDSF